MASPIVAGQEMSEITPRQKFEGHKAWIAGAVYLPGGLRMMTCSADGSLRVWSLKSGKQIWDDRRDGESAVLRIALSPDGKNVVSSSEDGGVRLWDIDAGQFIAKWMGHTKDVMVWSVCWSQGGRRVLSGYTDGTARQWDVEKGEMILVPIQTEHKIVFAAVYSPDMSMFATGGLKHDESSIKIWDTKTGVLVATLKGDTDTVFSLAWTGDGTTLISGSSDHSVRTWNTTTWKQIALLEGHTSGSVQSLAISPNGRILASGCSDKMARLWNLDNSQPISSPLYHANAVSSVSFSVDGKLLATGCYDENAYTWDVRTIVKEAGLDELLLDQRDKSVLAASATRRPVRQPIKVPNRAPQGFFDDAPYRSHVRRSAVVASPEATASSTNPHVTVKYAGRWIRFWLFICCASTEYTDGHH